MTIGMLIESMAGKAAALNGAFQVGFAAGLGPQSRSAFVGESPSFAVC